MTDYEFPIEKGIPVPPTISVSNRYPYADMDVGDSFFVPDTTLTAHGKPLKFSGLASMTSRKGTEMTEALGKTYKFISRTVEGGFRVWRVK
jgi:hypothetical protein